MSRKVYGPCFGCGTRFWYDPATVPALWADPVKHVPVDAGGQDSRAIRAAVCMVCVADMNEERAALGLPLLWQELTTRHRGEHQ